MYDRINSLYKGVGMRGSSNAPKIAHSNKNLLDNWDFTNPVNQREQTSYQVQTNAPSRVYTIDRWALSNISTKNKLVVSDNKITCSLSGLYSGFYQIVPFESSVMGEKTVTLSIIAESYNANLALSLEFYNESGTNMYTSNNITLSSSNAENVVINGVTYKLFKTTITLTPNKGKCHCYIINLNNNITTYSISLIAAKLELGEVSTLRNDALGVSYAEELRKCQRYYYDSQTESAISDGRVRMTELDYHPGVVTGNVFFPVQMRVKPAITIYSDQGNVGNLNNGINGEELTGLGAYANFYGRDCFSQVNLNKPLSQVTTVKEVSFHYTASADL